MCSPPMWTSARGLRAWTSNSRGALATCSITKSGSSLTRSPVDLLARLREHLDRLRQHELHADLRDDPPPAAVERGDRVLGEDLVPRHPVDEHALGAPRTSPCISGTSVPHRESNCNADRNPGHRPCGAAARPRRRERRARAAWASWPRPPGFPRARSRAPWLRARAAGPRAADRARAAACARARCCSAWPAAASPSATSSRSAATALERLGEASGETIDLAVPVPGGVEQYLAQVDSRHFLGTTNWVGRRLPAPLHLRRQGPDGVRRGQLPPGAPGAVDAGARSPTATGLRDELDAGARGAATPPPSASWSRAWSPIAAPVLGCGRARRSRRLASPGRSFRLDGRSAGPVGRRCSSTETRRLSARLGFTITGTKEHA